MSNNQTEHARVSKQITEALFSLLQEKKFSEITVTDLIKRAKVARASYYRHFYNKEEIIEAYMDNAYANLLKTREVQYVSTQLFDPKQMQAGFEASLSYFLAQKSYILALYDNGFGSLIQDILNRYLEDLAGDMPRQSLDRYKLYFISGAVCNILIHWLQTGAMESPYVLSQLVADYFSHGISK